MKMFNLNENVIVFVLKDIFCYLDLRTLSAVTVVASSIV